MQTRVAVMAIIVEDGDAGERQAGAEQKQPNRLLEPFCGEARNQHQQHQRNHHAEALKRHGKEHNANRHQEERTW